MCNYWLYILRHEPHVEGCTLAISVSPTERDLDGKLQTKHFKSWDALLELLVKVVPTNRTASNPTLHMRYSIARNTTLPRAAPEPWFPEYLTVFQPRWRLKSFLLSRDCSLAGTGDKTASAAFVQSPCTASAIDADQACGVSRGLLAGLSAVLEPVARASDAYFSQIAQPAPTGSSGSPASETGSPDFAPSSESLGSA